ncbi:MAG: glycosyltransferase family 2 protein [bacterium]|nr:glycosyltransferase family 2 protein [bacterium]
MRLSIIIPVYNESGNIKQLYEEITQNTAFLNGDYEIIVVNDGSKDDSLEILREMSSGDSRLKVLNFRYNTGQTAAMSAGIKYATGEVIIPMDGDGQNNPADIPIFLGKIEEGFQVVSGWRKNRRDKLLSRKIPSWIANWIIGFITGVKLHDYGCSMKAYTKEAIQGISLYGEMHRFIPAYVSWHGGKVAEIPVSHRPRLKGETNYGISRTFKVILDLIVVKFLSKYMNRPMHFFGGIGLISIFAGLLCGVIAIIFRITGFADLVETPLPILATLLIIVGVQLAAMGVVAEMLMRLYYESQNKEPYIIKETINFN